MTEQKNLTVTVRDLIAANYEVYEKRENPDGPQQALPQTELVAYVFDKKSHHGGISYYHEQSGTLVLAHRGSATVKDWLVTDRQIMFGKYETRADTHALEFADKVLTQLQATGKPVTNIIETGHSKGGRESQMVLAKLLAQGQIPCVGLTFNSARVDPDVKKGLSDIPHINLRMNGGSFISTDVVTSYGKHLGQTVDFPNPDVNFLVSAHSLDSFAKGLQRFPGLAEMDVREVVKLCQQGLSIEELNQHGLKSMADMDKAINTADQAAYTPPTQDFFSANKIGTGMGLGYGLAGGSKEPAKVNMSALGHYLSKGDKGTDQTNDKDGEPQYKPPRMA